MTRRCLALILALGLLLAAAALAADRGLSFIPDDCDQDPCACFIQLGDEGGAVREIALLLKEQGYLSQKAVIGVFAGETEAAVMRFQADSGLPQTGTLDDGTLTRLIWGMSPAELDAAMPVDPRDPATFPDTVFLPTDGGEDRHNDPHCSGMLDPRKVSIRNAQRLGFAACKKCEAKREAELRH